MAARSKVTRAAPRDPDSHILPAGALVLRQAVGTATADDGTVYEITTTMGLAPMVKNERTGLTWAPGWQALVDLARVEGVDGGPAVRATVQLEAANAKLQRIRKWLAERGQHGVGYAPCTELQDILDDKA